MISRFWLKLIRSLRFWLGELCAILHFVRSLCWLLSEPRLVATAPQAVWIAPVYYLFFFFYNCFKHVLPVFTPQPSKAANRGFDLAHRAIPQNLVALLLLCVVWNMCAGVLIAQPVEWFSLIRLFVTLLLKTDPLFEKNTSELSFVLPR